MKPGTKARITFGYHNGVWHLKYAWPCSCGDTHIIDTEGSDPDECLQRLRWRI